MDTDCYMILGYHGEAERVYVLGPADRWAKKKRSGAYRLAERAKPKVPIARCDHWTDQWYPDVLDPEEAAVLLRWSERLAPEWAENQKLFDQAMEKLIDWYRQRFNAIKQQLAPPLQVTGQILLDEDEIPNGFQVTTTLTLSIEDAERRLKLTPPPRPDTTPLTKMFERLNRGRYNFDF